MLKNLFWGKIGVAKRACGLKITPPGRLTDEFCNLKTTHAFTSIFPAIKYMHTNALKATAFQEKHQRTATSKPQNH